MKNYSQDPSLESEKGLPDHVDFIKVPLIYSIIGSVFLFIYHLLNIIT